jgi:hypothetical protein
MESPIQLITTPEDNKTHWVHNDFTMSLATLSNEKIKSVIGDLPDDYDTAPNYSHGIPFLYKGVYMVLYYRMGIPRLGGGTLKLAEEIYHLILTI